MLFQTYPAKYRGLLEHVYPSNHPAVTIRCMCISTKAHTQAEHWKGCYCPDSIAIEAIVNGGPKTVTMNGHSCVVKQLPGTNQIWQMVENLNFVKC